MLKDETLGEEMIVITLMEENAIGSLGVDLYFYHRCLRVLVPMSGPLEFGRSDVKACEESSRCIIYFIELTDCF